MVLEKCLDNSNPSSHAGTHESGHPCGLMWLVHCCTPLYVKPTHTKFLNPQNATQAFCSNFISQFQNCKTKSGTESLCLRLTLTSFSRAETMSGVPVILAYSRGVKPCNKINHVQFKSLRNSLCGEIQYLTIYEGCGGAMLQQQPH